MSHGCAIDPGMFFLFLSPLFLYVCVLFSSTLSLSLSLSCLLSHLKDWSKFAIASIDVRRIRAWTWMATGPEKDCHIGGNWFLDSFSLSFSVPLLLLQRLIRLGTSIVSSLTKNILIFINTRLGVRNSRALIWNCSWTGKTWSLPWK